MRAGPDVFFADPYAAWQRGSNGNTVLRQHLPKGTDLRVVSIDQLETVTKRLNHRPRKYLAYRAPREVFMEACRGAVAA